MRSWRIAPNVGRTVVSNNFLRFLRYHGATGSMNHSMEIITAQQRRKHHMSHYYLGNNGTSFIACERHDGFGCCTVGLLNATVLFSPALGFR